LQRTQEELGRKKNQQRVDARKESRPCHHGEHEPAGDAGEDRDALALANTLHQ